MGIKDAFKSAVSKVEGFFGVTKPPANLNIVDELDRSWCVKDGFHIYALAFLLPWRTNDVVFHVHGALPPILPFSPSLFSFVWFHGCGSSSISAFIPQRRRKDT